MGPFTKLLRKTLKVCYDKFRRMPGRLSPCVALQGSWPTDVLIKKIHDQQYMILHCLAVNGLNEISLYQP